MAGLRLGVHVQAGEEHIGVGLGLFELGKLPISQQIFLE